MKQIKITDEQYDKLLDIGFELGENGEDDNFESIISVLLHDYELNLHLNIENLIYCLTNYHKEDAKKKFEIV